MVRSDSHRKSACRDWLWRRCGALASWGLAKRLVGQPKKKHMTTKEKLEKAKVAENELWRALEKITAEMEPIEKRVHEARRIWVEAQEKARAYELLLSEEEQESATAPTGEMSSLG